MSIKWFLIENSLQVLTKAAARQRAAADTIGQFCLEKTVKEAKARDDIQKFKA